MTRGRKNRNRTARHAAVRANDIVAATLAAERGDAAAQLRVDAYLGTTTRTRCAVALAARAMTRHFGRPVPPRMRDRVCTRFGATWEASAWSGYVYDAMATRLSMVVGLRSGYRAHHFYTLALGA